MTEPCVDWLSIEASAPGKFILSGEYAVVYGRPAIATSVNLRTNVKILPTSDSKIKLNLNQLNYCTEWPTSTFSMCKVVTKASEVLDYNPNLIEKLKALGPLNDLYNEHGDDPSKESHRKQIEDAVMAFLLLYLGIGDSYFRSARPSISVEVDSSIPIGSGLGSSSAYAVALCGALMRVFRVSAEKYVINDWAHNIDKHFHGKPSGIDNSTITYGGYVFFQSKQIKDTKIFPHSKVRVLLIDSGVSRRTKEVMQTVIDQMNKDPPSVNSIFDDIEELTRRIWEKLSDQEFKIEKIAEYLEENQLALDRLGVGHEKLTDICQLAQHYEIPAKLTGAGGGGMAIALYEKGSSGAERLTEDLRIDGYNMYDLECGCEGLIVNITPDPENRPFKK